MLVLLSLSSAIFVSHKEKGLSALSPQSFSLSCKKSWNVFGAAGAGRLDLAVFV
jgi:hypothetical protein